MFQRTFLILNIICLQVYGNREHFKMSLSVHICIEVLNGDIEDIKMQMKLLEVKIVIAEIYVE